MTGDTERTALKEWAVLCEAMGRGDITAMIRKGGIREQRKGFSVRHDRFLLYPTYFHEKAQELAPRFAGALEATVRPGAGVLRLQYVASVAAIWRVTELEWLRRIDREHGLAWRAVESRFHYRGNPMVHVVAVRVHRLCSGVEVPEIGRYTGCVSWVELDAGIDVGGAVPVLPPEELERRLERLGHALGAPET